MIDEELYLALIAKELSGEISETERTNLQQWIRQMKGYRILSSPLFHLYLGLKKSFQPANQGSDYLT
ncbi:MAG TPA: hypothetical protein VNB90_08170 [Cytophagaceae bacterium]|jgi:hypothetical protein|nr:hypothetical protein [Cytophagaceae bacterium]